MLVAGGRIPTRSSGITGTRFSRLPVASRSAATIAGVATMVAGSPIPLTPYGARRARAPRRARWTTGGMSSDGRDEVVGEGRVADPIILLHAAAPPSVRDPSPIAGAALDLALRTLWVDDLARVLDGGDLDDADEAELLVDLDHRSRCDEGERRRGSRRGRRRRTPVVGRWWRRGGAGDRLIEDRAAPARRTDLAARPAWTAPPAIVVCRDAEVEPAEPTVVSAGWTTTCSTRSSLRTIWVRTVYRPCP